MIAAPLPRQLIAERVRFSAEDCTRIARCRRSCNRLGFAYQLAFVRLLGRFPQQQPLEVLDELLTYVALQLELDAAEIQEYARRQATASAHAEQIRECLGYRSLGTQERVLLVQHLRAELEHLELTSVLLSKAEEFLRAEKILLPAAWTLRRLIVEERTAHRARLFEQMLHLLPEPLCGLHPLERTRSLGCFADCSQVLELRRGAVVEA
jgi:hypothetical protein